MDHSHAISIYVKLAKIIPTNIYDDRKLGKYTLRDTKDPRFADRRMQELIRMILESLDKVTGQEKVVILWSTVKLR